MSALPSSSSLLALHRKPPVGRPVQLDHWRRSMSCPSSSSCRCRQSMTPCFPRMAASYFSPLKTDRNCSSPVSGCSSARRASEWSSGKGKSVCAQVPFMRLQEIIVASPASASHRSHRGTVRTRHPARVSQFQRETDRLDHFAHANSDGRNAPRAIRSMPEPAWGRPLPLDCRRQAPQPGKATALLRQEPGRRKRTALENGAAALRRLRRAALPWKGVARRSPFVANGFRRHRRARSTGADRQMLPDELGFAGRSHQGPAMPSTPPSTMATAS